MPVVMSRMQHRQPGLALQIEALWRNFAKHSGCRLFAIHAIDIEQHRHWRQGLRLMGRSQPSPAEPFGEGCRQHLLAPVTDALDMKRAAMEGVLEIFEGFELPVLGEAVCISWSDPRDRPKQRLRFHLTAQPFQLGPAPRCNHLGNRAGYACSDCRKGDEAVASFLCQDFAKGPFQPGNKICRLPVSPCAETVGALAVEEIGKIAEFPCHSNVLEGWLRRQCRHWLDAWVWHRGLKRLRHGSPQHRG